MYRPETAGSGYGFGSGNVGYHNVVLRRFSGAGYRGPAIGAAGLRVTSRMYVKVVRIIIQINIGAAAGRRINYVGAG